MPSSARGASLVELLIVIGVIALLSATSYVTYKNMNVSKALDTDTLHVLAELQQARSLTLSSKNADVYGVHFAASDVTLFQGATYAAGAGTNIVTSLNSAVTISSTTLAGGGSDVIFQRLTGETAQSGTVTLSLVASSSVKKTIQIYGTGIVDVQ